MNKDSIPPNITIKAKITIVSDILVALTDAQVEKFRKTCFGHWLDVVLKKNSQLLIHTILDSEVESVPNELSFNILGKRIRFRRQEFCLVTGLRFGPNMYMKEWVKDTTQKNPFRKRMFPDIPENVSVKVKDVMDIFNQMKDRSIVLEDDDAVKICLLVLLDNGFLGHQSSHNVSNFKLNLVDHLEDCWNIFPWGSYIWDKTYKQLRDAVSNRRLLHNEKRKKGEEIRYTLTGFVWAFMIWILEAIPATHVYAFKKPDIIPRALAWRSLLPFTWTRCCTLFDNNRLDEPFETLTPTKAESDKSWWKDSFEYFEEKHVQSEVLSEQVQVEKDDLSEEVKKKKKKRKRDSSSHNPTYDELKRTVSTLSETVSRLQGTIATFESRLLALEGDARDFGVVSDGDIAAYMSPGPSYTSPQQLYTSPAPTTQKSLPLANRRKLRPRRTRTISISKGGEDVVTSLVWLSSFQKLMSG